MFVSLLPVGASACGRLSYSRVDTSRGSRESAEKSTRSSAGAAARAKNPSAVADQMRVARVGKPVGLRRSVAGSSFIVVRKTSAAPLVIPPRAMGRVMRKSTCRGP